jgi:hypothetical protein
MLRVRLVGRQVGPGFLALVDSGADRSLFPVEAAREAALDRSNCRTAVMRGVGGSIDVAVCRIIIEIVGRRIEVVACFTDNPALRTVALLGRSGVFTEFLFGFDQRAGELLVEPYPRSSRR